MTTILTKTYANGVTRALPVVAVTATDNPDAVVIETETEGAVLVTATGDADLWAQIAAAGLMPTA